MARGDVSVVSMELPVPADPTKTETRRKYVVELQDGTAGMNDVAVVMASTHRRDKPRPFEAVFDQRHGFDHETVVDGRWVHTIPRSRLVGAQHLTTLSPSAMEEVSSAIAEGLELL